jgi:hypothetical protein
VCAGAVFSAGFDAFEWLWLLFVLARSVGFSAGRALPCCAGRSELFTWLELVREVLELSAGVLRGFAVCALASRSELVREVLELSAGVLRGFAVCALAGRSELVREALLFAAEFGRSELLDRGVLERDAVLGRSA